MMNIFKSYQNTGRVLAMVSLMAMSFGLHAAIQSTPGTAVDLHAKQAMISTPDGDSFQIWGFSLGAGGVAQYPAPTLRVTQGQTVSITVYNQDVSQQPVSLVFPGQENISKTCDIGFLYSISGCHGTFAEGANVVAADGGVNSITYTFIANKPGTYMYHSGVNPQIQIDMGLVGALIVDPLAPPPAGIGLANADDSLLSSDGWAYEHAGTAYDQEYLFLLSEMDPRIHYLAENNALDQWDNAAYWPVLWFINGRNGPDTISGASIVTGEGLDVALGHQPYDSLVLMQPGQRVLLRVLNPSRNQHPLHLHGNNFDRVARDGNMLTTNDGADLGAISDYTMNTIPGSTDDIIFQWTGKGMGWDIYNSENGHTCVDDGDNRTGQMGVAFKDGYDDNSWEWCADHGKPLPVVFPEDQDVGFGAFYGGSPYLGDVGTLPIGEGGLNPWGGMVFMWHSHTEKELANNDIFPGGMLTLMLVLPR